MNETTMDIITKIRSKFPDNITKVTELREKLQLMEIKKEDFPQILDYAHNSLGGHFMTMTGTDYIESLDHFIIDYILGWYEEGVLVVFRAKIRKGDEDFPSATPYVPCADWYEREVKESLGLNPIGHPNPRKLLLSDEWPEDIYPLRKNYKHDTRPPYKAEARYPFEAPENGKMFNIIPYGPYHFAIHEPIYFRFLTNGERIVKTDLRAGFNYRGLEKIAETRLTYETIPFMAERVCGICGSVHAEAYTQALEKAANFEAPERAKWIRTVMLEIERIHSHLLWLGVASHMVGFDSGFMQFWRVRDKDMFLAELLTGNRKLYGMIVPGGVRRDIREDKKEKALKLVSEIHEEYEELLKATLNLGTLKKRLKDVGCLHKEDAKKYSVMGPVARASGISIDSRRDYPYEAYPHLDFESPVEPEGDVLARTIVRAHDVLQSLKIIEQALESLPDGPVHTPLDYIPPGVTSVGLVEGPRGTDVHYIITGKEDTVYRWRVRAPTYANLQATPLMLEGYTLADASIIIGSIDPCISCAERVLVVDANSGKERILSSKDLLKR